MRILLVSQYFAPERTAAPLRLAPLAAGLARLGHDVQVVCELPSHPEGAVYPGFRGRPIRRRTVDGYRVTHVWSWPSRSRRAIFRLRSYATFGATGTLAAISSRKPDVVFASSPPLSLGLAGEIAARRFRVPWVLDVRDLWPDVAVAAGQGSRRAVRIAGRLERHLYAGAAAITVPTEAMRAEVGRRSAPEKVHVLANGASELALAAGDVEVRRADVGLAEGRFVWTYAGNVGLTQGLDTAVQAAGLLGDGFRLLIVGDGASRRRLEAMAADIQPGSVEFLDPVDVEVAVRIMRASDALLVSLAEGEAVARTMPVKLYDACAVGRPVIVAAPGEPARVASAEGVGPVVRPGDARALAEAVRVLAEEPARAEQYGAAGRGFAKRNTRESQVASLEAILTSAVAG